MDLLKSVPASNLEIIVVDDDPINRLLHASQIKKFFSHPVTCFRNGKLALEYLDRRKNASTNFLIFLDIHMPVMDGWEFLEKCTENFPPDRLQVVMVSSSTDREDRDKAFSFPHVLGYCEKPLTKKYLLQKFTSEAQMYVEED